jgi:hypothetical protein
MAKAWDLLELIQIGAKREHGKCRVPDLNGPVHLIFERDRWDIDDDDYQLLLPSMRLATRLLEVGMPYAANFLPSSKIFGSAQDSSHAEHADLVCPDLIPLKLSLDATDFHNAQVELAEISKCVTWCLNEYMYAGRGWNGITRLVDEGDTHFRIIESREIEQSDMNAANAGDLRRPLVIAIMDLYLVPMRTNPNDSEIRLKAEFMAAVTMVHEIGHAIFHQDFRSFNPENALAEPFVGSDCVNELGKSFIAYIFGGYHPQFCIAHQPGANFGHLGWSLCWEPAHTLQEPGRPYLDTLHAIPVTYIEEKMTQSWWHSNSRGVISSQLPDILRTRLKPSFPAGAMGVCKKANFTVDTLTGRSTWKGGYRIHRFSSGQPVAGISREAVISEMQLQGQTFDFGMNEDEYDYGNRANSTPDARDKRKITRGTERNGLDELETLTTSKAVTTPASAPDVVPTLQKHPRSFVGCSIEMHNSGQLHSGPSPTSEISPCHPATNIQASPQQPISPTELLPGYGEADLAAEEISKVAESSGSDRKVTKRGRSPDRHHATQRKRKVTKV